MFPEPSFSTTALAIVSCTLVGSGIGALFGYLIGYDVGHDKADGECRKAIGPLRTRIQELNEMLIWRDLEMGECKPGLQGRVSEREQQCS